MVVTPKHHSAEQSGEKKNSITQSTESKGQELSIEKEKGEVPRTDVVGASVSKATGKLKQPDQAAAPT